MSHEYDGTGVQVDGDFTIPDDEYILEVLEAKEGKSKQGEYQVTVHMKVAEGARAGFPVRFHRVTFKKPGDKGAGIALAFLKACGQPYKDKFLVEPDKWCGARIKAYLTAEEYNGRKSMKVKWAKPLGNTDGDEEVPF